MSEQRDMLLADVLVESRAYGAKKKIATALDVSVQTVHNKLKKPRSISDSELIVVAEALGLDAEPFRDSIDPSSETGRVADFVAIPRYDANLAAGAGAFNERAQLLDHIPFTKEFLAKKLGRSNVDGLVMLEARGDSMEPTIGDGDLVLVDQADKNLSDGILAFVHDDTAYVKRVRHVPGGIEVISDNRADYPPYQLSGERLEEFRIIGRVRWIGRVVGR